MNLYLLFSIFYFVQGAIQSYYSNFQKPYLVSAGVPLAQIALISSFMLAPFWIKSVFGLISDRFLFFGDHRKSYMVLGLSIAALCFLAMSFVLPGTQFGLFFALVLISTSGMALFDTCADGMAVNITPANQEGLIQSSMMFGRGVGSILLSFIFGQLAVKHGYPAVFQVLAALVFAVLLYVMWKTPKVTGHVETFKWPARKNLKSWFFQHKEFWWLAAYSILYSVGSFGIDGITTLYGKLKFGFSDDVLGNMGSAQGVGSVMGALLAALVIAKWGSRFGSYLGVIMISVGGIMVVQMQDSRTAMVVSLIWGILWAFQETVILVLCMKSSQGRFAAAIFATLMMFSNVGTSFGEWIATTLLDRLGLDEVFWALALGNLLLIPFLFIFFRRCNLFTPVEDAGRLAKM